MTLHELAQQRGPGQLHDSKFMLAAEKSKVLKQWEGFLKSGCAKPKFTKALYNHLTLHCSFIAHYDIHGFYATYFESGDSTIHFLSQFDDRKGMPQSTGLGMYSWITSDEYYDINCEMVRIAGKYIPVLIKLAKVRQRRYDIAVARQLLAKHDITLKEEE